MNGLVNRINSGIKYCFYLIFFLVPLVIYPTTFELFEFNKMWITFGLSLVIFFLWFTKTIVTGKLIFRRTPIDLPILLFLASQFVSTIMSLDTHVSLWGYYSRFNGGFLSLLSYIFLYYAFVSNLVPAKTEDDLIKKLVSYKLVIVSLITGSVVALWGLPSHFGYDPTCLVFRGKLDVGCWTDAFQPMVRIFSTLGQPNWLAAYLSVVIPVSIAFFINNIARIDTNLPKNMQFSIFNFQFSITKKSVGLALCFLLLTIVFYIDLIYSGSQSGFVGAWVGILFFLFLLILSEATGGRRISLSNLFSSQFAKVTLIIIIIFLLVTFLVGIPINRFDAFTMRGIASKTQTVKTTTTDKKTAEKKEEKPFPGELGGTDSGKIRSIVWSGAIEIFKQHPLFGTGVETFAFAYYKVKPIAHNLTSEWDFLYNKAHNEYLNLLATTGIFGFGTYMAIIIWFLWKGVRSLLFETNKLIPIHEGASTQLVFSRRSRAIISFSLLGAYVAILISNFFGFSVVIVNLYLFLIPAFVYELSGLSNQYGSITIKLPFLAIGQDISQEAHHHPKHSFQKNREQFSLPPVHVMFILILGLVILYLEFLLVRFWVADQKYAAGNNLDKFAGLQGYIDGNPLLSEAVSLRPGEDLFADELSINLSTLALIAHQQNQASQASEFTKRAIELSDGVVKRHPNNVIYYKTRTRLFYNLSQIDPQYYGEAVSSISHAQELAPTDAKIVYNKALLYAQAGKNDEAIKLFQESIDLKPNYLDCRYQFAQLYDVIAKSDSANASLYKQKAIEQLNYILANIDPIHKATKDFLKELEGR